MGAPSVEPVKSLPPFSNEPVTDFSKPANREAMRGGPARGARPIRARI